MDQNNESRITQAIKNTNLVLIKKGKSEFLIEGNTDQDLDDLKFLLKYVPGNAVREFIDNWKKELDRQHGESLLADYEDVGEY